MTNIQKAILADIKAHCTECDYCGKFNKGLRFLSMRPYTKTNSFTVMSDGTELIKYEVKCKFSAAKYENNVVVFMVNLYSDGTTGIYFDGTEYQA